MPLQQTTTSTGKRARTAAPFPAPSGATMAIVSTLLFLCTATAYYKPEDGPGQVCRLLRPDETAFALLPAPAAAGELPAVTLVDDQDLWPLFEAGGSSNPLGEGLTLRLEAWVPPTQTAGNRCVPAALTLTAGAGGLRIPLPAPANGWQPGQWSAVEAAVTPEVLVENVEEATWGDLDDLVVSYECSTGEENGEQAAASSIKVRLVRLCKPVPTPSLCLVSSTVEVKTDCRPCNRGTCCEPQSFTACSKALTYGIAGLSGDGARVLVKATREFVESSPALAACRFGTAAGTHAVVVPATILSPTTLACVAPPAAALGIVSGTAAVPVEVTLDGGEQWTHDGRVFTYCADAADCERAAVPAAPTAAAATTKAARAHHRPLAPLGQETAWAWGLVLAGLLLAAVAGAMYVQAANSLVAAGGCSAAQASIGAPLLACGRAVGAGAGAVELVRSWARPPPLAPLLPRHGDDVDAEITVLD